MTDREYMRLAVELAKKGAGKVGPNPMVGAVIVKNGKIIGSGYHGYFGGPHAEVNAINNCTESPEGATIYVTLEPCCHHGKTPPCTDIILKSGISRVVLGQLDFNPIVSGNGMKILKDNNIDVEICSLDDEFRYITRIFKKFILTNRPFVLMKYAMTMDGKIATYTNDSKWISCEESRNHVHDLRNQFAAIMVGVNTVIADDPLLTCRLPQGRNPIRIICDTNLRTPISSNIIRTSNEVETYIATSCKDDIKIKQYTDFGCKVIVVNTKDGSVDLFELMEKLGKLNIDSVLLEGGSMLNWSALNQRIVDEAYVYISPKVFGGDAKTPISGKGIDYPNNSFKFVPYSISRIGCDYLIESDVDYSCLQE